MELKVGEYKTIPEGRHEATIVSVIRRSPETDKNVEFDYTDYNLQLADVEGVTIKYGVPTGIKVDQAGEPRTAHARLLKQLGFKLSGTIDTDKAIGLKVSCLVQNDETSRGTFARVVDGSIKRL
jgi:hypothetical protein